eukprot:CAMPEP_0116014464 /NCGR_PEP_ID=MMETSP0321-20121206/6287_1 /TAXON_ID=163516 /ORGANISM="Leptocylindrus danicus var. danicus, Strain B650" /LENGTH=377 /DNA_ID=CAMNT_0003484109 /DNA_START=356 /DNA_END=1489 /DNA_ORIENTATION=+
MTNICMVMAILLFFYSMKVTTAFTVVSFAVQHKRANSLLSMVAASSAESSASAAVVSDASTPVLSPHSFEGLVERGMIDRFGSEASRIVQSWRMLEADYEHKAHIKDDVLQFANSYVPGLTAKCWWDTTEFSWCKYLEDHYDEIKTEFMSATSDMEALTKQGNNVWAGALTDDASAYGVGWSTLVLLDRGTWDPTNVALFPKTAKVVRESGIPAVEVFFASMKPKSEIKMHSDFTNFVLTSHLALDIPESGSNKCRLTVGDETRQWINGQVTLFDTSIMHDATNEADKTRYILMFRLWHPELSSVERDALQFIYDCLEVPDLVNPNDEMRLIAEQRRDSLRAYPLADATTTATKGFSSKKKKNVKNQKGKKGKGFGR